MAFFVKNITITPLTVHGITLAMNAKVDLTLTVSNADIVASLISGELFDKITGRALAIVDISTLKTLGATTDELSTFARIGYFQGKLGEEDFKDPFNFTFSADGYLLTSATIGSITVESQSEVEGRVVDGYSAAGIKPVIISGVDEDGYSQSLLVSVDGEAQVAGYDAALDAVRTFETAPLNYYFVTETLVNATNQAVATYYYSTNVDNYKDISFEIEVSANVLVTVEASNAVAFTVPKDITKAGNELVSGASGFVNLTNGNYVLDFDDINISYLRIKAVIGNATNSLKVVCRKKAL